MAQKPHVVVATYLRRVSNGESRQDGSELWLSWHEDQAFTFASDQPISDIYDALYSADGDLVSAKLL